MDNYDHHAESHYDDNDGTVYYDCPPHNYKQSGHVDHQPHHNPGKHLNVFVDLSDDELADYCNKRADIHNDNRPTVIVYRDNFDDLVAALALDDDANRYLHLYAAATNLTTHTPTTPGDEMT